MKPTQQFQQSPSQLSEVVSFLRRTRKWYLIPIAVVIAIMSLLIILGGTAAAPFIYTLF